jgi:hypothetical protein
MAFRHQARSGGVGDHVGIDWELHRPTVFAVVPGFPLRIAAAPRAVRFLDAAVVGRPVVLSHGSPVGV